MLRVCSMAEISVATALSAGSTLRPSPPDIPLGSRRPAWQGPAPPAGRRTPASAVGAGPALAGVAAGFGLRCRHPGGFPPGGTGPGRGPRDRRKAGELQAHPDGEDARGDEPREEQSKDQAAHNVLSFKTFSDLASNGILPQIAGLCKDIGHSFTMCKNQIYNFIQSFRKESR